MDFSPLRFLDTEISMPFRFASVLPFTPDDKRQMPWLKQETRLYAITEELKKGGRAIAYRGVVLAQNRRKLAGSPEIVLKLPNLDPETYDSAQIQDYLRRQSEEGGREWQLTRKRLHGCRYANPIFDFEVLRANYLGELVPLPITAQLYLPNALSLGDHLVKTHQRVEPYISDQFKPYDNWHGMTDPNKWIDLAHAIAIGLADIHQRRVVHGDIWPPNIFIREEDDGSIRPIFIDFGEAFPIEPQGVPQEQRDHAYRAPERKDAESIVTQQADVYSFGKLILHLAIGEEPTLPSALRGHKRRAFVRSKFINRNRGFAERSPFIIDIICKCLSFDPIDRPSMLEVARALRTYVDSRTYTVRSVGLERRLSALAGVWRGVRKEMTSRRASVGPLLEALVEQRISELESTLQGLSNEVVVLNETRERLLIALISLFQRLNKGDRYISLTNPKLWQGSALGLDGRYFTSTILAAHRGASIQRAFIISVQELGEKWTSSFVKKLFERAEREKHSLSGILAEKLNLEVGRYIAARYQNKAVDLSEDDQRENRERFKLVLQCYSDAKSGLCKSCFEDDAPFTNSIACDGIYLGIIPVATIAHLNTLKAAYPVSVFYYDGAPVQDKYLLMMTDCLGRNSRGSDEKSPDAVTKFQKARPELRGVTVFKSVLGVPEDRIKKLEQVFRSSVSVGPWVESLLEDMSHIPD